MSKNGRKRAGKRGKEREEKEGGKIKIGQRRRSGGRIERGLEEGCWIVTKICG